MQRDSLNISFVFSLWIVNEFCNYSRRGQIQSNVQYRKWSSTASDPQSRRQMIPKEKCEWLGLKLADYRVDFIIITNSKIKR